MNPAAHPAQEAEQREEPSMPINLQRRAGGGVTSKATAP
jgi:hypothetical protein